MTDKTASLTAQNTYSGWLPVGVGETWQLAIDDTAFSASISIEAKLEDADATYITLRDADITTAGIYLGEKAARTMFVRFGIDTGDYTSGTVNGTLSANRI